jgi:hypothetical protein
MEAIAKIIGDLVEKDVWVSIVLHLYSYLLVVCYSVVVYLGSVARARNKKPSFLVLRDQVETDVGTAFAVHLGMEI